VGGSVRGSSGDEWEERRPGPPTLRRRGRSPLASILRHSKRRRAPSLPADRAEAELDSVADPDEDDARQRRLHSGGGLPPAVKVDDIWTPGSPPDFVGGLPGVEGTEIGSPKWAIPALMGPPAAVAMGAGAAAGSAGAASGAAVSSGGGGSGGGGGGSDESRHSWRRPRRGGDHGGGGDVNCTADRNSASSGARGRRSVAFLNTGTPPLKRRKYYEEDRLSEDAEADASGGVRGTGGSGGGGGSCARNGGGSSSRVGGRGGGRGSGRGGGGGGGSVGDDRSDGAGGGDSDGWAGPGGDCERDSVQLASPKRWPLRTVRLSESPSGANGRWAGRFGGGGDGGEPDAMVDGARSDESGCSRASRVVVINGGKERGRGGGAAYGSDEEDDDVAPMHFSTSSLDSRSSAATRGDDTSYSDLSSDDFDSLSARSDGSLRPQRTVPTSQQQQEQQQAMRIGG
ncbi:unnamed protein product, partial [Phaeothamnion confervicola]